MKISKSVLQAVTVAVVVTTMVACTDTDNVGPEKQKAKKTKTLDPCPACGMG